MRAARIENGVVVDIWEVPSLTAFKGVELFSAGVSVQIGNLYDGVVFTPSVSQQAKIDELAATEYQRNRAEAYPSTVDQLDDIYHNGVDGWKATIKAVKDKYPKETI